MFINLAHAIQKGAPGTTQVEAMNKVLTEFTAEQLAYYIDRIWEQPRSGARVVLPIGGDMTQHQGQSFDIRGTLPADKVPLPPSVSYWQHLIYAYMLEATNMASVFQRVVFEWTHGERLPFPSLASQMWLRTTEQVFFTTPQPPGIRSLMSDVRPDRAAIRRNAYYRMFGLDLPAGASDGRAYVKADAANRDFVRAWEHLMREVWRAYVNLNNSSGQNTTDSAAMQDLVRQIREMLLARRTAGALAREEFDAVSFYNWFHLTVLADTQVVTDLSAQSTSPALRLKKIADQVGVPVHAKADSFFQMASTMATVLAAIETGSIDGPAGVQLLYGNLAGAITPSMLTVITHWPVTTAHDIKADIALPGGAPRPAVSSAAGGHASSAYTGNGAQHHNGNGSHAHASGHASGHAPTGPHPSRLRPVSN